MLKRSSIRKAVFPVAGLGTRFLPATKASPKEMLPVVDKPLIQYAVEEAVAAGVTELIFVTGRGKRAIEDHFDQAVELDCVRSWPWEMGLVVLLADDLIDVRVPVLAQMERLHRKEGHRWLLSRECRRQRFQNMAWLPCRGVRSRPM